MLGSGFTSRLTQNVRDREGLTYDVRSYLLNDSFVAGEWRILATFAPELLDKGQASVQRELQQWYEGGITADELARRKKQMIGLWYVRLSNTEEIAEAIQNVIERGHDLAWLDDYPKALDALTVEQVNRAIKAHLDPQNMVVIKAGTLLMHELER